MVVKEQIFYESIDSCDCIHRYALKEIIKSRSGEQGYRQNTFTKIERYFCEKCLISKDLIFKDTDYVAPDWY